MNKNEIYVPINNRKEAKQAKAVLKSLGEPMYDSFSNDRYYDTGGLYFNTEFGEWAIAISFGGVKPNHRKQITLNQLIELLVSEVKESVNVAVKVENEKEFKALMKYYDSLGWKWSSGSTPLERDFDVSKGRAVDFHDNFAIASLDMQKDLGYQIIPFSEFAEQHGIKLPLLTSEDGVDLYSDSKAWIVFKSSNKWVVEDEEKSVEIAVNHSGLLGEFKMLSTKQAALDWIDAQKPKSIELFNDTAIPVIVRSEFIELKTSERFQGLDVRITRDELNEINKAMEELNND